MIHIKDRIDFFSYRTNKKIVISEDCVEKSLSESDLKDQSGSFSRFRNVSEKL